MTTKNLLTAISSAKVDDERGLDEIDCLVYCFLREVEYYGNLEYASKTTAHVLKWDKDNTKYTRSRDALKAIRPKGWYFIGGLIGAYAEYEVDNFTLPRIKFNSGDMPTEELAELYCIIAAIQHDRANTEGGDE